MEKNPNFFHKLGVYGFGHVEPVILAALVSEDPILLIGNSGTGKTFLLNSISEALGLEHRHYNASLISFDDLVGFPYPAKDGTSVDFLPTPATIWQAESVLVDELSRCKPETQNKFFSIVHERKVQGMELSKLRYRWAAMNPFRFDGAEDNYEGSQPLDPALADRFAFVIEVPDWLQLEQMEQELVIYPAGEDVISNDNDNLKTFVDSVRLSFIKEIINPARSVVTYARLATTLLTEAGFRMSPRRARLLSRNIIAMECVAHASGVKLNNSKLKKIYKLVLQWSLPHRAWKNELPDHIIDSVHAEAARLTFSSNESENWISEFLLKPSLSDKVRLLFADNSDMDNMSLAVIRFMNRDTKARTAIFAFCTYPLLQQTNQLNEEALQEVVKTAMGVLEVKGELVWDENINSSNTMHQGWTECSRMLNRLTPHNKERRKRAKQLFLYLLTQNETIADPDDLEMELNKCFRQTVACAKKITKN